MLSPDDWVDIHVTLDREDITNIQKACVLFDGGIFEHMLIIIHEHVDEDLLPNPNVTKFVKAIIMEEIKNDST